MGREIRRVPPNWEHPKKTEKFEVGQNVKVYALMNPRRDLKGIETIKAIGPMYGGGPDMLWFENGGGAHHPDACEAVGDQ